MTNGFLAFGAIGLGCALAFSVTHACTPAAANRTAMAATQAAYGTELNSCYENAKSYKDYEACAEKVDAKFGVKP